jgi:predicted secreted protein
MNSDVLQADEKNGGHEVELTVGDVLELRLKENPSTGFQWTIEASPEPACVLEHDEFENRHPAPGGEGTHCWKFRAAQKGDGRLHMLYHQSWNKNSETTFAMTVRVTE